MQKYYVFNGELRRQEVSHTEAVYLASEVDAVLKRQAAAAISGMNAATAISSGQVRQAHRLRAESNPEALESERQANAILTERVAELESELDTMNLAVGYFHEENDRFITRIAELEQIAGSMLSVLNVGIPISPRSVLHDDLKSLMET